MAFTAYTTNDTTLRGASVTLTDAVVRRMLDRTRAQMR